MTPKKCQQPLEIPQDTLRLQAGNLGSLHPPVLRYGLVLRGPQDERVGGAERVSNDGLVVSAHPPQKVFKRNSEGHPHPPQADGREAEPLCTSLWEIFKEDGSYFRDGRMQGMSRGLVEG